MANTNTNARKWKAVLTLLKHEPRVRVTASENIDEDVAEEPNENVEEQSARFESDEVEE